MLGEVWCEGVVWGCEGVVWCEAWKVLCYWFLANTMRVHVCFPFKMAAVGLLLQAEPATDSEPVLAAKRLFAESGDALGALSLMPRSKLRERMVLKALHRHGHTQVGGEGRG